MRLARAPEKKAAGSGVNIRVRLHAQAMTGPRATCTGCGSTRLRLALLALALTTVAGAAWLLSRPPAATAAPEPPDEPPVEWSAVQSNFNLHKSMKRFTDI
jgi:hypothetical protein